MYLQSADHLWVSLEVLFLSKSLLMNKLNKRNCNCLVFECVFYSIYQVLRFKTHEHFLVLFYCSRTVPSVYTDSSVSEMTSALVLGIRVNRFGNELINRYLIKSTVH